MGPYIFAGALYGIGQLIALLVIILVAPSMWFYHRRKAKQKYDQLSPIEKQIIEDYQHRIDQWNREEWERKHRERKNRR